MESKRSRMDKGVKEGIGKLEDVKEGRKEKFGDGWRDGEEGFQCDEGGWFAGGAREGVGNGRAASRKRDTVSIWINNRETRMWCEGLRLDL
jgi:hypothetical protein